MRVRAIEKGYYRDQLIMPGTVFNYAGPMRKETQTVEKKGKEVTETVEVLPTWMEPADAQRQSAEDGPDKFVDVDNPVQELGPGEAGAPGSVANPLDEKAGKDAEKALELSQGGNADQVET